jgi:hypothetical protein
MRSIGDGLSPSAAAVRAKAEAETASAASAPKTVRFMTEPLSRFDAREADRLRDEIQINSA